jgi:hypothetical protein
MSTVDDRAPCPRRSALARKGYRFPERRKRRLHAKLLDKNPVYVYRFGDRLDKDNVVNFDMIKVKDKDGNERSAAANYLRRVKGACRAASTSRSARTLDRTGLGRFRHLHRLRTWVVKGLSEGQGARLGLPDGRAITTGRNASAAVKRRLSAVSTWRRRSAFPTARMAPPPSKQSEPVDQPHQPGADHRSWAPTSPTRFKRLSTRPRKTCSKA